VPLGLGDDSSVTSNVVVGVVSMAVRLGGSGRNEEGRGNREGLHFE
jgi:hypothetical protein